MERRKPRWHREEPDAISKNGHKVYHNEPGPFGEDIIEKAEADSSSEIGTLDSGQVDLFVSNMDDSDSGIAGFTNTNSVSEICDCAPYQEEFISGHARAEVFLYGNAWAFTDLMADVIYPDGGGIYNVSAAYERWGDAVTGMAHVNQTFTYHDSSGSPTTIMWDLEEPTGRDEGWNSVTNQIYIPSGSTMAYTSMEIYVEASAAGGGSNTDFSTGDRGLYPDYVQFEKA